MSQTLYIMQGVPGSSKSTLAKKLVNDTTVICSTDDFFVVDGVYKFDGSKLPVCHKLNLDKAIKALKDGLSVVVDNTNIERWQCRSYVEFAKQHGIPVVFIRVHGNFPNTHGVPADRVLQMKTKMEDLSVESVLASKAPWE